MFPIVICYQEKIVKPWKKLSLIGKCIFNFTGSKDLGFNVLILLVVR